MGPAGDSVRLAGVVWVGVAKLCTDVCVIFVVDRVGRRPLLLIGGGLCAVVNFGIGLLLIAANRARERGELLQFVDAGENRLTMSCLCLRGQLVI